MSSDTAAIKVLVEQTKHRTIGCQHSYGDHLDVSLFSQCQGTKAKRQKLEKQLVQMLKLDQELNFVKPGAPSMPGATDAIPSLGKPGASRQAHTDARSKKLSSMLDTDDDEDLLELELEFKGKCLYDKTPATQKAPECRKIVEIEWDQDSGMWCARTEKCDGSGKALKQKRPEPYGLKDEWLPEMRRMIAEFEARSKKREGKKRAAK